MSPTLGAPLSMAEMTWTQMQEAMNDGIRNVIFAVGATEQHGPHLPLSTDTLIGTATSLAVATRIGATMVAPTIAFGVSPHHMSFPGTVSLREATFLDVVEDYVRSLAAHGFDNILVISSHGGNFEPLAHLIERVGPRIGETRIHAHTDLLQLLAAFEAVAEEDSISPEACGSHAGDFETSIVLALRPDLVDMNAAEPGFLGRFDKDTATALFDGGTKALSVNGILGDPVAALASRGERYLESLTTVVSEYFRTEIAQHEGTQKMTVDVQRVVQAELDAMVAADTQLGIQVAVYQHGQLIVDAWSGHTEPTRSAPVRSDTLFPIFSCSKGLMYTTVHLLAERGELDYDARVSDYWPEFGQNGKGEATIRQVLVHTSGVQDITHDFHLDNWDGTCARLAESEAMWTPGSETAYRGLSSGFVLGEVASRVYGKPFGQIVAELICEPLGITDLFFGVPPSVRDRIAVLANDESVLTGPASSPDTRIMAELFNTPSIQASAVPAGGAITSARSLAKHYASLIGDGVDGVRLLPLARTTLATTLETDAYDQTHKAPIRKGLGYLLGDNGIAMGGRSNSFGHSGFGGSYGFADPDYGLSFALTKNRLVATTPPEVPASVVLANTVREALSVPNG